MPNSQDGDDFELDELGWQHKEVQDAKKLARNEHIKWCSSLRNLRDSLVRRRRLLAEELSAHPNFRQPFSGRAELALLVEVQAGIDAIDRAIPEEEALLKEHDQWSAENERDWAEEENRIRTMPTPFRRPSFLD